MKIAEEKQIVFSHTCQNRCEYTKFNERLPSEFNTTFTFHFPEVRALALMFPRPPLQTAFPQVDSIPPNHGVAFCALISGDCIIKAHGMNAPK
ncbi:hypothetical protein STEG23_006726, partial [Scotinomys teguina]